MFKMIRAIVCQDHTTEWRDKILAHPNISFLDFRTMRWSKITHPIDRVHCHDRRRDKEAEQR